MSCNSFKRLHKYIILSILIFLTGIIFAQNSHKSIPAKPLLEGLAPPMKRNSFPKYAVWRGEWQGDKNYNKEYVFIFEVQLNELEDKKIKGAFYWELKKIPFPPEPPYSLTDIGKKATEFVRGKYDPLTQTMTLDGYSKDDPDSIIGLARYKLTFNKDHSEFNGVTQGLSYFVSGETDGVIWTKKVEIYTFENVIFKPASEEMLPESYPELDKTADWLKKNPAIQVYLNGHTDRGNSDEAKNHQLSLKRAQAVSNYLITKGVSSNRLTPRGFGNTRPLDTNETEEGRKKNRRVEIEVRGN